MLVLFDVDATLILTGGAGMRALEDAGRELHGPEFKVERTEFAGRLDPLIIADLLRQNGVEVSAAAMAAMRARYRERLAHRLADGRKVGALRGVQELLAALRGAGEAAGAGEPVLGLLTGNFPETGAMKLRACGIEPEEFPIRIWGDDSPHDPPCREHLPPVAMSRFRALRGRDAEPGLVTVVGDTPHDVACARASGCRSLGVATGSYTQEQLRAAGADQVVADLSQTAEIVRWLTARR